MSQTLLTIDRPNAEDAARGAVVGFIDAVNAGDLDHAMRFLTEDSVQHGRIADYHPAGVKVVFTLLRNVLPDLHLELRDQRVDGDRVISRIVGTGTHTGSYLGRQATNRPIVWESVDIARVVTVGTSTVIAERFWDVYSDARAWQEIGFIPGIMC